MIANICHHLYSWAERSTTDTACADTKEKNVKKIEITLLFNSTYVKQILKQEDMRGSLYGSIKIDWLGSLRVSVSWYSKEDFFFLFLHFLSAHRWRHIRARTVMNENVCFRYSLNAFWVYICVHMNRTKMKQRLINTSGGTRNTHAYIWILSLWKGRICLISKKKKRNYITLCMLWMFLYTIAYYNRKSNISGILW